jgi:tetratricopeptide (TPR) repeat protein
MTKESFTREIFVGRQSERVEFHNLLRQALDCQVLHLYGGGGTGKTCLLEWIAAEILRLNQILDGATVEPQGDELLLTVQNLRGRNLQHICATDNLVDFYKTAIHTPLGMLTDIARQLKLNQFLSYSSGFEVKGIGAPGQWEEVQEHFLKEYRELAEKNMTVLLFDTFEAAGPTGESLLTDVLPKLCPNTLVVIVGRRQVTFSKNIRVTERSLSPLTDEDAIAFFRQRALTEQIISAEQIKQMNVMVAGRPIYLALAIDWLVNAEGTVEELIRPQEDLGQALVKHILQLKTPENTAILYLAHIWRLGEPELLMHLLKMSEAEVTSLTERLGRYSFVKYREPGPDFNGSCLLHDEMRDLVQSYCWPDYDLSGANRKALTRLALEYYEQVLRQQGGEATSQGRRRAEDPSLRNYQVEWIYYQLQLDLEEGLQLMDPLFRDAAQQRDMAFCQQILDELKRPEFWNHLIPAQQAVADFRQGLILYRQENYDAAEQYWQRITGPGSSSTKSRATALQLLSELYGDKGQVEKGLDCARQAESAYKALLSEEPDNRILRRELGELYNNWGRLVRIQEDYPLAIEFYQRALTIYKDLPPNEVNKGRARTLNNLGFVYYLIGNMKESKVLCGRAIALRETLNIKYELGLSYNTMGMILDADGDTGKAATMYAQALIAFDEVSSSYGRGLTLINHGRMHRNTLEFTDAFKALEEAEMIFRRLNNPGYLAETLNELGSAYRARRLPDDIAKAKECFEHSFKLGGDLRKVDNLTDMAMMFAQLGNSQETHACLAQAEPLIDKLSDDYFRGQTYEIRANLYFAEGEKVREKDPEEARSYFQKAFDALLEAAALYADCMSRSFQLHRAERRYGQILDLIQNKLNTCPSAEIPSHVERLKNGWQARNFANKYNDLIETLQIFLDDVTYF